MILVALGLTTASLAAPAPTPPPTVVVSPFVVDGSDDYAWLATAIAQRLTDRLNDERRVSVFSQKQWAAVLRQRDVAAPDVRGEADIKRIAAQLGADEYIYGHIAAAWPDVVLFARRVSAADGEVKNEVLVEGALDDVLGLEQRMVQKLFAEWPAARKRRRDRLTPRDLHALTLCRDALFSGSLRMGAAAPAPGLVGAVITSCAAAKKTSAIAAPALVALAHFLDSRPNETHALPVNPVDPGRLARNLTAKTRRHYDPTSVITAQYLLAESGDDDGAIALLRGAIKKRPGFLHAHLLLAEHLRRVGDAAGSAAALDATLRRAPHQPWAMVQRGKLYAQAGDVDAALELTARAVEKSGGDAVYLMEQASRLIDAKRYPDAERVLRDALAKDPRQAKAYVRLGYVYLMTNQVALAEPVLLKALYEADRVSERSVVAYAQYDLAKLYARQKKPSLAQERARRAVAAGFDQRTRYAEDPDLRPLLSDRTFDAILR